MKAECPSCARSTDFNFNDLDAFQIILRCRHCDTVFVP